MIERRTETDARERIGAYLRRAGLERPGVRVVSLTGDASNRRYFRVMQPTGETTVLALYAEPFEYASLPFVNVANLFRQMPVPVPAILDQAGDLGLLVLEDLGDVTLQAHLGTVPPEEHTARYREAVDLIVALQHRGAALASARYVPYSIAFDEAKLTWELNFFVRHFLEAYRGAVIGPAGRALLADTFQILARELAAEPRVLCHRDYHSRNLMVCHARLYTIDFQDARLGPDTYDLASLLRDSYVDLPEPMVDELIRYFIHRADLTPSDEEFRRRFDVMALQRNLKALGTFGYQTAVRGNPVYIQYVPRTLRHVRDNLVRHERWAGLQEFLASHVEELG